MSDIKKPMTGVRVWKNPVNEFVVFELHYSADPEKRSEIFREATKSKLPLQKFLQEYEIQWDTYEGTPVYRDYDRAKHHVDEPPVPERGLPFLLGWDFGLTPACIIAQLQGERLVIIEELTEFNMGAKRFAKKVRQHIATNYPFWGDVGRNTKSWIDPSGFFRKDTDENTCKNEVWGAGFREIFPGPVDWETRRSAVEDFLIKTTREGMCFVVSENTADVLVKGFAGGYHYPENAIDREDDQKPEKNMFSHAHDALQYLCFGVNGILKKQKRYKSVPRQSYSSPKR